MTRRPWASWSSRAPVVEVLVLERSLPDEFGGEGRAGAEALDLGRRDDRLGRAPLADAVAAAIGLDQRHEGLQGLGPARGLRIEPFKLTE